MTMTELDVAKLTYTELLALRARLDREIGEKRDEELKVLADGYVKKAQAAGFTADEAFDALRPYVEDKQRGKRSDAGAPAPVMYRDPQNPQNTWSGRGRAARWLAAYEEQGRNREEFRVSGATSPQG
ncbi:DNA-binding protein H-NS [Mitsuaria sp. BK045]|uniref:H-NS histone family protein n=2 Tax=unclassified Roseateles TaxID=2626991 RepID=UPI001621F38A|nr:H-NS histone family protein [Mitsuaria sp. BK045]MBB3360906.1 DNA-binding protein H-NS [Mitsuaria sp. BK045]